MPAVTFNSANRRKAPSGSTTQAGSVLDLRGLDLSSPVDAIKDGRTPYAKNFRLYAKQEDSRQVAVSSRKGQGYIMEALGQTSEFIKDSTAGASTTSVGIITGQQGVRFQAASNNRLTKIDLKPSDPNGDVSGTLLVEIWSDNAGKPGKRLSASSIQSSQIGDTSQWLSARFVNAVKLTTSSYYWVIVRMQDDGVGEYTLDTTTNYFSYATDSTLQGIAVQTYGINIRIYGTPEGTFKGGYRYLRDNGANTTVVVYGTTMYYLDDDELVEIVTGLSALAEVYSFASADNKLFWANGYDGLTYWDGTFFASNANLVSNGTLEVNATGWTTNAAYNGTVTRTTAQFHGGVASLSITNSSGIRAAWTPFEMKKFNKYRISYWVKVGTAGNVSLKGISDTPTASNGYNSTQVGSTVAATTSWQQVEFDYVSEAPFIGLQWEGASGTDTVYIDDISVKSYGVAYITDDELDIPETVTYHKDRLWTKSTVDHNKLQFSEAPGNPTARTDPTSGAQITTKASEQWYNAWRSVDYWYVPRPFNGSPVVGALSFQDALAVFTQDKKYTISGYDTGSFFLRESTGAMGALGRKSMAVDENFIYFVAKDGFYRYNGSADEKISKLVSPLFDACPRKEDIRPVVWKNQVRFYMASSGSTVNDICLIWDKDLEEWAYDTNVYVNDALWYKDTDDDSDLIEFSSVVPVLYRAEVNYHSLGAPIDFEYRFKYDSMKSPGQKKRIKRFVPILQGVDTTYPLTVAMDKDFEDSPKIKKVLLVVNGSTLGNFTLGDGTILGGNSSFKAKRQSYSGYANYWQFRLMRNAVNNRVAFVGAQYTYKTKRL